MDLPQHLKTAIADELASLSAKRLTTLSADLSERYRSRRPSSGKTFVRSQEDVSAYAAFRLPATFAAVYSALEQMHNQLPDWSPQTLLDVGAGPGSAMWAAASLWPDLDRISLLEREKSMIELGKRLSAYSPSTAVHNAIWHQVDITGKWETSPHDLVIASYVLGELMPDRSEAFIHQLWENTGGTLIIIEPGTPAGYTRIIQAREQLIAAGAKTVAPCPHDHPCPMAETEHNWCHFAQRVARSRIHRQVKSGELAYEDEKFSFVSMSRTGGTAIPGRIVRHPQIRTGHIHLEICAAEGLKNKVVSRKDRTLFRQARSLRWGSVMPESD